MHQTGFTKQNLCIKPSVRNDNYHASNFSDQRCTTATLTTSTHVTGIPVTLVTVTMTTASLTTDTTRSPRIIIGTVAEDGTGTTGRQTITGKAVKV